MGLADQNDFSLPAGLQFVQAVGQFTDGDVSRRTNMAQGAVKFIGIAHIYQYWRYALTQPLVERFGSDPLPSGSQSFYQARQENHGRQQSEGGETVFDGGNISRSCRAAGMAQPGISDCAGRHAQHRCDYVLP